MQILAGTVRVGWMVVGLNCHQQPSTKQFQTKVFIENNILFFHREIRNAEQLSKYHKKNFVAVTKIIQDKAIHNEYR